jgi:hypothetical protein
MVTEVVTDPLRASGRPQVKVGERSLTRRGPPDGVTTVVMVQCSMFHERW